MGAAKGGREGEKKKSIRALDLTFARTKIIVYSDHQLNSLLTTCLMSYDRRKEEKIGLPVIFG